MSHPFLSATLIATAAIVMTNPMYAQIPPPIAPPPPQWPLPQIATYPFAAPTPADAYREGLINRWEYERYEPLPSALQGPPANGSRGGDSGGGRD